MMLLILMSLFFVLGAILGTIWRWRVWLLFAAVLIGSCLGSLYVAEFPTLAAIFNDAWSFLYFVLNYGIYVGLIAAAGSVGAFLGLIGTKKIGKRRQASERVCRTKSI